MNQKIQIFIITEKEIEEEYTKIYDFIVEINERLEKAYNIEIDLMPQADPDAPPFQQEEYKKKICESETVFFLVFTKLSDSLKAYFEGAYNKLKTSGKPDMYTYFYTVENKEVEPPVKAFMRRLEKEINHYWSTYDHIDTIKLKILMSLKLDKLNMVEMSFRDGKLIIDENEVMSLKKVKMYSDNDTLCRLRAEYARIEKEYFEVRALYVENKKDKEICEKYLDICTKREIALKNIEDLDKQLFEQSLNMIKTSRGELTEKQVEAYRLFEEGKSEKANEILNPEDIERDYRAMKRKTKRLAQICINEYKTKIEILETMIGFKERFNQIVEAYERIKEIALEEKIEYNAVVDYGRFLYKQGKSKKALKICKELEKIYNDNPDISKEAKAHLYNALGLITDSVTGMQEESEKYHLMDLKIRKELADENPGRYKLDLAGSYNNIGLFYYEQGAEIKAEEYYLKAVEIMKELEEEEPNRYSYSAHLAANYNNLGNLYSAQGIADKVEKFYLEAMEIRKKLATEIPDMYSAELADSYNNIGVFYGEQRSFEKAKDNLFNAMEIRKNLAGENPERYNLCLAGSYINIGNFYMDCEMPEDAKKYYLEAVEIMKSLAEENPNMYNSQLAGSYDSIGMFYRKCEMPEEAKDNLFKALEIRKKLAEENSKRYSSDLAKSYDNIGTFYVEQNSEMEAADNLFKALEIRKKLAEENPKRYSRPLAGSYNNIGIFYKRRGIFKEAANNYLNALEIIKKLAEENPQRYNSDLADSYNSIGGFYEEQGMAGEAADNYLKAIEIIKKSAAEISESYNIDLAVSYYDMGVFYLNREVIGKAIRYLKKAYNLAKKYPNNSLCNTIVEALKDRFR